MVSNVWVPYNIHIWFILKKKFFDVWGLCLFIVIDATHFEENWTLLEGGEVHDTSCEYDYVLDFIVKPLGDPNPHYILIQLQ